MEYVSKQIHVSKEMRRLIYDMYYADEISEDIAIRLLEKLEQIRNKRKRY